MDALGRFPLKTKSRNTHPWIHNTAHCGPWHSTQHQTLDTGDRGSDEWCHACSKCWGPPGRTTSGNTLRLPAQSYTCTGEWGRCWWGMPSVWPSRRRAWPLGGTSCGLRCARKACHCCHCYYSWLLYGSFQPNKRNHSIRSKLKHPLILYHSHSHPCSLHPFIHPRPRHSPSTSLSIPHHPSSLYCVFTIKLQSKMMLFLERIYNITKLVKVLQYLKEKIWNKV